MRYAFNSISLFLLLTFLSSGSNPLDQLFVPPGSVRVTDAVYFDKTEVSNAQWREYGDWIKMKYGESSPEYKESIPDTLVWQEALNDKTYSESNLNPAFSNHPVVGISYEQAAEYCKWKTATVREKMKSNEDKKMILPESINYRLPSKAEWEEAAKAGLSEKPIKQLNKKRWYGFQPYNAVRYDSTYTPSGKINPDATITAPVDAYYPNKLGIYNLFGNAGEMVAEKGIYKGGGWNDKMDELKAERDYRYEKPASWLGFRCACEVH